MEHVMCLDCTKLIGCKCDDEARESRMPAHLPSVDPTFLDGVREFAPDEKAIGEKETP